MSGKVNRKSRHSAGVFYAIGDNDVEIGPLGPFLPVDDVTGKLVEPENIVFQDGLLKDARMRAGSIEKESRFDRFMVFIMYDPAKGFQRRAAGEVIE